MLGIADLPERRQASAIAASIRSMTTGQPAWPPTYRRPASPSSCRSTASSASRTTASTPSSTSRTQSPPPASSQWPRVTAQPAWTMTGVPTLHASITT